MFLKAQSNRKLNEKCYIKKEIIQWKPKLQWSYDAMETDLKSIRTNYRVVSKKILSSFNPNRKPHFYEYKLTSRHLTTSNSSPTATQLRPYSNPTPTLLIPTPTQLQPSLTQLQSSLT